ncbi:MAG: shikimate kinase [Halocynthiibacter sp.]
MTYHLKKSIVLVGMMGAGKTAIGTSLAARLSVPFLDSDEEIVKAAKMPISDIFERDGEAFFRARESEVIARLLDGEPTILSTGGGAFLAEENRNLIASKAVSLRLAADVDLLWSRVRHKNTRPLLRTDNPRKTLEDIFAAREPIYEMATLSVHADPSYSIEEMTDKVVAMLLKTPEILEET